MIIILLSAIILSVTIIYAPDYLFSSEQFAQYFFGYGGIIHEASVAFIVSTIFLVGYLLKRISINRITQISIGTSIFIAIVNSLVAVFEIKYPVFRLIRENFLLSICFFFFGIVYYSIILILPTLIFSKVVTLIIKLKTWNRD